MRRDLWLLKHKATARILLQPTFLTKIVQKGNANKK